MTVGCWWELMGDEPIQEEFDKLWYKSNYYWLSSITMMFNKHHTDLKVYNIYRHDIS